MKKKNKRIVRVIALVLAALLLGGVIVSALFAAWAEPAIPERNQCEISLEYLETEQALHIMQRLVYINRSKVPMDRVVFYTAPNMLRRQSALMYEQEDLEALFPEGFTPGGIDLRDVRVDGAAAEYGFQGEDELYLRVACDIAPGARAEFTFDYYLLLSRCGAFTGAGDTDVRLGAFCFVPGVFDAATREFILKKPLPFTRWLYADAADYRVSVSLPDGYALASTGAQDGDHIVAEDAREFALVFGKRYRIIERATESGVRVRVFSPLRGAGLTAERAVRAVEQCEEWFGPYPVNELDIAKTDYPLGALSYPGLILLPETLMGAEGAMALRACVARQLFGLSAYPDPVSDAWLSDSVSRYVAYLMLEADEGRDAFVKAANRDWVPSLQITIPGGLNVSSDASLFNAKNYAVVVLDRGAAVLNELREAMGLQPMLEGLRRFYELRREGRTLTEADFVHCLDEAGGGSWEDFLADWIYNAGDYVNQQIDWYD